MKIPFRKGGRVAQPQVEPKKIQPIAVSPNTSAPAEDLSAPSVIFIVYKAGRWPSEHDRRHDYRGNLTAEAYRSRQAAEAHSGVNDLVIEYRQSNAFRLVLTPE